MNIKLKALFVFFAFNSLLYAMEREESYPQVDESSISDVRRIAILGYGSLINDPRELKIIAPFTQTNFEFPVSLSRESSQGTPKRRITAVIDNQSQFRKPVWYAESEYKFLPNARNNLALREGVKFDPSSNKRHLANIFYLKKLLQNRRPDSNESKIGETDWVVRNLAYGNNDRQQLPVDVLKTIINWADSKGFSAIIWASFPPNKTNREIIQALRGDSVLLANTKDYVRILPGGPQTDFEKAIIDGNL